MSRFLLFVSIILFLFANHAEANCLFVKDSTQKAANSKKALKGLQKAVNMIGYLNYNDRKVDRVLSGIQVFEYFKGKRINEITVKVMYPYGVDLDSPNV